LNKRTKLKAISGNINGFFGIEDNKINICIESMLKTLTLINNNYMIKLICISILTLSIVSCNQNKPQSDKGKELIDKVCDSVMQNFSKQNFSQAFSILEQYSVISPSSIDTLEMETASYAHNIFPAYGKIRSFELVSEHKVKDFIIKRLYILKFDKYYLKFDFTLYNNGDNWTITSFEYNEDLMEVLY
jgi:hypothetical protein